MSAMKEHLEEVNARLHEVLSDISADRDLIEHAAQQTADLACVGDLQNALTRAALAEAEAEGGLNLGSALHSAFLFGLAAGIHFERRGYKL